LLFLHLFIFNSDFFNFSI